MKSWKEIDWSCRKGKTTRRPSRKRSTNWLIELIRISSRGKGRRKMKSCRRDLLEERSSSNTRKRNNKKFKRRK